MQSNKTTLHLFTLFLFVWLWTCSVENSVLPAVQESGKCVIWTLLPWLNITEWLRCALSNCVSWHFEFNYLSAHLTIFHKIWYQQSDFCGPVCHLISLCCCLLNCCQLDVFHIPLYFYILGFFIYISVFHFFVTHAFIFLVLKMLLICYYDYHINEISNKTLRITWASDKPKKWFRSWTFSINSFWLGQHVRSWLCFHHQVKMGNLFCFVCQRELMSVPEYAHFMLFLMTEAEPSSEMFVFNWNKITEIVQNVSQPIMDII